jgi:hypothetical protein
MLAEAKMLDTERKLKTTALQVCHWIAGPFVDPRRLTAGGGFERL